MPRTSPRPQTQMRRLAPAADLGAKGQRTKDRILDEAEKLMLAKGYDATTIGDITDPGGQARLVLRAVTWEDYVAAAVACARFIETELRDASGALLRTFNRGRAKLPAFLEDHAYLLEAYLTLYEATFDVEWFTRAVALADDVLEHFFDPERGGFFSVSDDHTGLIARRKDLEDAPIPSGGSAACFGLLRLARFTGEARYEDAALSLIKLLHPIAPEHPLAFGHLLRAIDFHLGPVREVALAGDDVASLARVVRGGYFPYVVLAGGEGDIPLLRDRAAVDGQAAAYVCERFTCQLPVLGADALAKSLQD